MRGLLTVGALIILVACQTGLDSPQVSREANAPQALSLPADACWARDTVPAQLGTVYDTDAQGTRIPRQVQIAPAQERLFAVPCPDQMDADFTASLQRALAVRGLHSGGVTGVYDSATAQAVRLYQAPQGLDRAILSLQAAQQLGLVVVTDLSN